MRITMLKVPDIYLITGILLTAVVLLVSLRRHIINRLRLVWFGSKFPGPFAFPFVGNALDAGSFSGTAFMKLAMETYYIYGSLFRFYIGPILIVTSTRADDNEKVLSSYMFLEKSLYTKFLKPWLGEGLLLSSGEKWRRRRKALTPAFHFHILERFAPVFRRCSDVLVQQLRPLARPGGGAPFDVTKPVHLLTLDVICETAMGVQINAQIDSDSPYVNAVNEITCLTRKRILQPWFHPMFLYKLSPDGRKYQKCLDILHGTTSRVIRERKEQFEKIGESLGNSAFDIDELGRRRRVAFLDLLLMAARDEGFTDADIREEVDTFMFEGHDTTASGLSFAIYLLSRHEDVQDKIVEELKNTFDPAKPFQPTMNELSELKYLEMVIKESIRIFPPVPAILRDITEDSKIPTSGEVMPGGTLNLIAPQIIHRDPTVFPDPEKFDPERFTPDECVKRHPYAYLPFSAGPRNCIGQRFAMLEMKSVLAKLLWCYRILPEPGFEVKMAWNLILKPHNGVRIRLEERSLTS